MACRGRAGVHFEQVRRIALPGADEVEADEARESKASHHALGRRAHFRGVDELDHGRRAIGGQGLHRLDADAAQYLPLPTEYRAIGRYPRHEGLQCEGAEGLRVIGVAGSTRAIRPLPEPAAAAGPPSQVGKCPFSGLVVVDDAHALPAMAGVQLQDGRQGLAGEKAAQCLEVGHRLAMRDTNALMTRELDEPALEKAQRAACCRPQ